jgi:hypothetical protein
MLFRCLVTLLFTLAAVLPIIGFARLLWRSQTALNRINALVEERGTPIGTIGDHNALWNDIREIPKANRNAVIWDICLVGSGLLLGAAASIWTFITS